MKEKVIKENLMSFFYSLDLTPMTDNYGNPVYILPLKDGPLHMSDKDYQECLATAKILYNEKINDTYKVIRSNSLSFDELIAAMKPIYKALAELALANDGALRRKYNISKP